MVSFFVVGEKVVVFVVFVLRSCRVQKYMVDNYSLVDQYSSNRFFRGFYCIVVDSDSNKIHLQKKMIDIL